MFKCLQTVRKSEKEVNKVHNNKALIFVTISQWKMTMTLEEVFWLVTEDLRLILPRALIMTCSSQVRQR